MLTEVLPVINPTRGEKPCNQFRSGYENLSVETVVPEIVVALLFFLLCELNGRWRDRRRERKEPKLSPLLLRRYTGAGGWHETCAGVLGLTKMDWNNNTLYKKVPVTQVYSKAFANIIQQNPNMIDSVFDFRNFM